MRVFIFKIPHSEKPRVLQLYNTTLLQGRFSRKTENIVPVLKMSENPQKPSPESTSSMVQAQEQKRKEEKK